MRKVEKFDRNAHQWVIVEFQDLKDSDIFRLFDNDERYINKTDGNNVWIAIGEPYSKDDIWNIDTIY